MIDIYSVHPNVKEIFQNGNLNMEPYSTYCVLKSYTSFINNNNKKRLLQKREAS